MALKDITLGSNHCFTNHRWTSTLTGRIVDHYYPALTFVPAFARLGYGRPILDVLAYDLLTTDEYVVEDGSPVVEAPSVFQQIDRRIEELRGIAAEEGVALSNASLSMAAEFLGGVVQFAIAPKVFLLDSGNLRVAWRADGEQVASGISPLYW